MPIIVKVNYIHRSFNKETIINGTVVVTLNYTDLVEEEGELLKILKVCILVATIG